MYRNIIMGSILVCILTLGGCGQLEYPDLPKEPVAFNMGEFVDENDDDAYYGTIEYEGRTYMPYGTLGGTVREKDIDECIGYIIQNENSSSIVDKSNKDTRVYTLVEDSEHNYLMKYYIGDTEMNQPDFWRAVDTKGQDINTPKYIDSLEYLYWEKF